MSMKSRWKIGDVVRSGDSPGRVVAIGGEAGSDAIVMVDRTGERVGIPLPNRDPHIVNESLAERGATPLELDMAALEHEVMDVEAHLKAIRAMIRSMGREAERNA